MASDALNPACQISVGRYLNLSLLFEALALDCGISGVHLDATEMKRRFLARLNDAERSSGLKEGLGLTLILPWVFAAHCRHLIRSLAQAYEAADSIMGADLTISWPNVGTGARLVLDAYRMETVRQLNMGSEESIALLGYDPSKAVTHPDIDGLNLMTMLGQLHRRQIINKMTRA